MGYFQQPKPSGPLFNLGRTVASRGISDIIVEHEINLVGFLTRHHHGDWGDLCDEDKQANDRAIHDGARILSKYHIPIPGHDSTPCYIITESDRSITTILLTSEY